MSNVFRDLKPRNSVQRNGFDLSRRSVFSTKCGIITPVFCQATLPDSEYRIDVKQLLRTQPLQTAAFTGFTINYDFFFVPNNYGYSSFNEFISQRDDRRHVGQPTRLQVPNMPFAFFPTLCKFAAWDYLLIENFNAYTGFPSDEFTPGFSISVYQSPWQSVALDCVRSLDMFGYGNFLPVVKIFASSLLRNVKAHTQLDVSTYSVFIRAIINDYIPWLNTSYSAHLPQSLESLDIFNSFLTYCFVDTENELGEILSQVQHFNPTVWPFLAYNKGFYEYYRSVYYDDNFDLTINLPQSPNYDDFTFEYVELFNFDDFTSDYKPTSFNLNNSVNVRAFLRWVAIICPKHHLYKKDLFTGVLPSTQFGDVSTFVDNRSFNYLQSQFSGLDGHQVIMTDANIYGSTNSYVSSIGSSSPRPLSLRFNPALAISVLEQRRADAMQRFKERMLRAGNKVKDVFKAHGWSEPYSASEASPVFLGTFDGRLDINTVAATAESENFEVGQLGANGLGIVNGSKIQFKCHDFGVIVGVMYIVKDCEYDAYGIERQHCLIDPFDYPYPELQNISLFPVDYRELTLFGSKGSNAIVGYLPRFMEYKTGIDKVHGEFFSAPIDPADAGYDEFHRFNTGVFSDWVTPRQDMNYNYLVSFLYQSPRVCDNIFKMASSPLQSTDQFLVNCMFDVMAVEPVSVIGLPI